ncbi:type III pantothenate kinase [Segetibacter sp.]|jgi:type III pantothenate kinase|uniref:type III pantothenate kinase n=1 Tax=Segetibacter sp. TaxID=2231182 RepID=UPI00263162E8|nr:type III pantothenate kinase [Segetibacter sp.]MCW3080031.1 type pantothenate kinase [Segetibacter sp.]
MTTLCFDFGNTRLKYAVFVNRDFAEECVLQDDSVEEIERVIEKHQPRRTILSSVIDHNPAIEEVLGERTAFHKLSYDSKLPITSPVGKPHTIGADRLAMVVAAVDLFPRQHNLVVGLGTCITYNFVNKYHQFIGGSISPGMEMRFKSLQYYTAKLPLVEADWNFPLLGYDTKTNIQSGVIAGMAKEIDGIIDLYNERFVNFNVHLTGGDIGIFGALLKNKIFADPSLIYKGLYAISEYNHEPKT